MTSGDAGTAYRFVIARECNDRGDPVIINLFAVANTVLWIATPLTWPAMTREDAVHPPSQ